jgi:hypothetical protein
VHARVLTGEVERASGRDEKQSGGGTRMG